MKQTTLRTILAAAVVAVAAPHARAGLATNGEVTISGKTAWGDTHDARHSDDDEQYIGCSIEYDGVSDKTDVRCIARDKDLNVLSCWSYKAGFVGLVGGIGDYASISFTCQGPNLVTLKVSKSSTSLP
jgi:hypothetical protein